MMTMRLKICSGSRKNYKHHPQDIIQGKWLNNANSWLKNSMPDVKMPVNKGHCCI